MKTPNYVIKCKTNTFPIRKPAFNVQYYYFTNTYFHET